MVLHCNKIDVVQGPETGTTLVVGNNVVACDAWEYTVGVVVIEVVDKKDSTQGCGSMS